jgi:hypothetical protein
MPQWSILKTMFLSLQFLLTAYNKKHKNFFENQQMRITKTRAEAETEKGRRIRGTWTDGVSPEYRYLKNIKTSDSNQFFKFSFQNFCIIWIYLYFRKMADSKETLMSLSKAELVERLLVLQSSSSNVSPPTKHQNTNTKSAKKTNDDTGTKSSQASGEIGDEGKLRSGSKPENERKHKNCHPKKNDILIDDNGKIRINCFVLFCFVLFCLFVLFRFINN